MQLIFIIVLIRSFILLSDVLDDICRLFVLADFRNIAIIMFAFISKVLLEDFNNTFSNYDMTGGLLINIQPRRRVSE